MATYNGGKYLKTQIKSILNQQFKNFPNAKIELIISDDGSTDDSLNCIEEFSAPNILLVKHSKKKQHKYNKALFGATENFINAMNHATGDYIFLSDQDDVWYPHKIDTMLLYLQKVDCCACAFDWIDEDDKKIGTTHYKEMSFISMCKHFPLYGFSMAFKNDFVYNNKREIKIPNIPQHDIFLGLVAKKMNQLILTDEVLCAHRKFGTKQNSIKKNVSDSGSLTPFFIKIYYRLKMILFVLFA